MGKFTGRDGALRIYDSKAVIPAEADMSVLVYDDSLGTYTEKAAEARADDASYTGTFWVATNDKLYVGGKNKFALLQFLKDGGAFAVAAGALTVKYYNGSAFASVEGLSDGTASGGNTHAANGNISFKIPEDWALQGIADLDADKYYVELSPQNVPGTPPSADIIAPVDGQYFEVAFAGMDFEGPLGRPRTEEELVLNRGVMDAYAHYVEKSDGSIYEAVPISFSCLIDDAVNKTYVEEALACGTFNDGNNWTAAGVSTKGDTMNDGTNANPAFFDTDKKTVNIMMLFTGSARNVGWAYYETYFPKDGVVISESDEGVKLTARGGCFGLIERIAGFGNRYT